MNERVKHSKLRADEEWGAKVSKHYKGKKTSLWKEVNGVRKKKEGMETRREKWIWSNSDGSVESAEKIDIILNVDERKDTEISTLGMDVRESRRVPDSTDVGVKEIRDARIDCGKSPVMYGVKVDM